jgi:hypothetical protein
MKTCSVIVVCFALLSLSSISAAPLGTAFTYQARVGWPVLPFSLHAFGSSAPSTPNHETSTAGGRELRLKARPPARSNSLPNTSSFRQKETRKHPQILGRTPILLRHPSDEFSELPRDPGTADPFGSGDQPPEQPEASPLPTDHRVGLHDDEGVGVSRAQHARPVRTMS